MLHWFKILFPRLSENFRFALYVFNMIQVSEIAHYLPHKKVLSKKEPSSKADGFEMSHLDLNQTWKIVFTENF